MFSPIEEDLNSFIRTFRSQRAQSKMTNSPREATLPPSSPPSFSNTSIKKSTSMNSARPLPSLSDHDIQKMKYKIDLDKQVAEKTQRNTLEWETKLERDKKYAKQQAVFGRHDHSNPIRTQDLEQMLAQSGAPSPLVLNKPEQLSLHYQQANTYNGNNSYSSSQQPTYDKYSHSAKPTKSSSLSNDFFQSSIPDFQRYSGSNTHGNGALSTTTTHPVKGDAHDPFISFDPNKETQQVFNIIPQQNLYEPWGRPGAGAPLIHQQTGQKFTRYAGSLEDKLNTVGPLSLYRSQYGGNINDQKRDMKIQQNRREEERMERRLNPGDTAADWISHIEGSHHPLNFHKPTTETTRHFTGTHDPYSAEETRSIRNGLAQQAEERIRLQQIARYEDNIADLYHTEVQNSWWGREGVGAGRPRNRRLNATNNLNTSLNNWNTNAIGQPTTTTTDNRSSMPARYYDAHFSYPKNKFVSKHTNFYQLSDSHNS